MVSIKVLGSGCKACHELYENTKEAVKNAGLSVEVEYITDLEKVMGFGNDEFETDDMKNPGTGRKIKSGCTA